MKNKHMKKELQITNFSAIIMFVIISMTFVYLMYYKPGKFLIGDDFGFHHLRIDWLVESIKSGHGSSINYNYLDEKGYGTGIFYPDILLYPIALLKASGLTYAKSYMIYYTLLILLGFIVSYFSFKQINNNNKAAFVFAILYGLATYRIANLFVRSAIGEFSAMAFFPLVLSGLHSLFYGDQKKIHLIYFGMIFIIYSHLISIVLISSVIVIMLVLNYDKILEKKIMQKLTIIGVLSVITGIFLFSSIFEQGKAISYKYATTPVIFIGSNAPKLDTIFNTSLSNSAISIGTLLLSVLGYLVIKRYNQSVEIKKYIIVSIALIIITSNIFPWSIFNYTPLNSIQFQFRFYSVITVVIAFVFSLNFAKSNPTNTKVFIILFITAFFAYSMIRQETIVTKKPMIEYVDLEVMAQDSTNIGWGEEYLPTKANKDEIMQHPDYAINDKIDDSVEIIDYKRENNEISFKYKSDSDGENVIIPFVYYKGYEYIDSNKDNKSDVTLDKDYGTYVNVNVKGEGEIKIKYQPTPIQRVSLLISSLTFIGYSLHLFLRNRKEKNERKNQKSAE